jgi:hypothetical protein
VFQKPWAVQWTASRMQETIGYKRQSEKSEWIECGHGGTASPPRSRFRDGRAREEGNTLLNGGFTPGRTTATPPRIRVPALFYSAGTIRKINREGFITAPFGTTPWVANRQRRSTGLTAKRTDESSYRRASG